MFRVNSIRMKSVLLKCVENKFYFLFILMLLFYVSNANMYDIKSVSNRKEYENYRMCASNFEIHPNKIIRTDESLKLGAKYLLSKDVSSKDECVKLCCEIHGCNVFVIDGKVLVQCGAPVNFKCKFAPNKNYESAVLLINRPQMEMLEDEAPYTQHERELINLRNTENDTKSETFHDSHSKFSSVIDESGFVKNVKEKPKIVEDNSDSSFRKSGTCSRYQFECRTSGECIAIYNACDGIPQCADHSDEDVELGCPTNGPSVVQSKNIDLRTSLLNKLTADENVNNIQLENSPEQSAVSYKNINSPEVNSSMSSSGDQSHFLTQSKRQMQQQKQQILQQQLLQQKQEQLQLLQLQQQSQSQIPYNRQLKNNNQWQEQAGQPQFYNSMNKNYFMSANDNSPLISMNGEPQIIGQQHAEAPFRNYDRESELANTNFWRNKNGESNIVKQNYGPLHNFDRKQSEIDVSVHYGEPGNVPSNSAYDVYNNGYARSSYNAPNVNPWSDRSDLVSNAEQKLPKAKGVDATGSNNVENSGYYHGEVNAFVPKNTIPVLGENSLPKIPENSNTGSSNKTLAIQLTGTSTNSTLLATLGIVKPSTTFISTTTEARKGGEKHVAETEPNTIQNAHLKLQKPVSVEVSAVHEQLFDVNEIQDGYTEQPSGAFVSLTVGVCVTAIMIFVVGCRLKIVRKRIRRGGKVPYANDADFLVNGMYL